MPDVTSDSSDENSDEADTNTSSQENGSSELVDVVPVQSSEQSSSEDVAAARSVNAGLNLCLTTLTRM